MASEALQQVGAELQGGEEVEPAVAAAGAFPAPVLQMDHKAGAGVLLTEAGGHDAHHTLMPVLAGQDQGAALALGQGLDFLDGFGTDALLDRLAFPVQLTQLAGQLLGPGGVVGHQQLGSQVGGPHAPCGVDPRGQDKPDLDGGDGLSRQARLLQKGVNAHKIRVGQRLQPPVDDGAVLPLHAHHIGHSADGGQGGVAGKEGVLPVFPAQGQHQLQRHAHAGQGFERVGAVAAVGIHHGHGVWQHILALVVVGDDHIHA